MSISLIGSVSELRIIDLVYSGRRVFYISIVGQFSENQLEFRLCHVPDSNAVKMLSGTPKR